MFVLRQAVALVHQQLVSLGKHVFAADDRGQILG